MKKIVLLIILLTCKMASAQTFYGEAVTLQNDTLKLIKIKTTREFDFTYKKILDIQDKITFIHNGVEKTYYPKDLKSFRIKIDDKSYTFDAVKDIFAQRLYAGKVGLYKVLNQDNIRYYLIVKPNTDKIYMMPAMGLSRLITKKSILPGISDCKASADKIESDEIKIKDEDVLVEFIKDYEKNCFSN